MAHSSKDKPIAQGDLVFVTGATGLLGSNLVRELVARGYRVRGLVRSAEKAQRVLGDLGAAFEPCVGDMQRVNDFAPALAGAVAVFHTAAYFREYYQPGSHDNALDAINIQGTLALMQAADRAAVPCFVHTSSSGTIGLKADGSPGDENTPASAIQLRNGYVRSKVDGDRAITAFEPASGMRVVEILPGWMWGPGDAAPTAAGQLVLDFIQRKIPVIPDGGTSTVDARDVASAMIASLTRAAHGDRYLVGGEFRTLAQTLSDLETLTGVRGPRRRIPYAMALAYASFEELRARVTGGPLLVSRAGLAMMHGNYAVTSSKAQQALGVTFRPFTQTLVDVIAWYEAHGYLPRSAARAAAPTLA
ncbi:MAG: NAD-dependent epimerase/dehydratase family protein [Polyangiales bacterium]